MKGFGKFNLSLPLKGETGYDNKSTLVLVFKDLGELKLGRDAWDLSSLDFNQLKIQEIRLGIPSGNLELKIDQVTVTDTAIVTEKANGSWDGILAGLYGGMSGYCGFDFDRDSFYVLEGVYCCNNRPKLVNYESAKNTSRSLWDDPEIEIEEMERLQSLSKDRFWYEWLNYCYSDAAKEVARIRIKEQQEQREPWVSRRRRKKEAAIVE